MSVDCHAMSKGGEKKQTNKQQQEWWTVLCQVLLWNDYLSALLVFLDTGASSSLWSDPFTTLAFPGFLSVFTCWPLTTTTTFYPKGIRLRKGADNKSTGPKREKKKNCKQGWLLNCAFWLEMCSHPQKIDGDYQGNWEYHWQKKNY